MSCTQIFTQDGLTYSQSEKNFISCVRTEGYFTIRKTGALRIFVCDVYSLRQALASTKKWFSGYAVKSPSFGFKLDELGVDAHMISVGNECCFMIANPETHELIGLCFASNNLSFDKRKWEEAVQALNDLETDSLNWAVFQPLIELELSSSVWSPMLLTKVRIDSNHYSLVEVAPAHSVFVLAVLACLFEEEKLPRINECYNKFIPDAFLHDTAAIHSDWYDFLGLIKDYSTLTREEHHSVDWDWDEVSGGITLRPTASEVYTSDRRSKVVERSFESECQRLGLAFKLEKVKEGTV